MMCGAEPKPHPHSPTLEIGQPFKARPRDKNVQRPVEPAHHAFHRQALDRGARDVAADRRIVELAGHERSDLEGGPDHYLANVEAFLFVKTFALGDLGRNFVEARGRNADMNDFAARRPEGSEQRNGESSAYENFTAEAQSTQRQECCLFPLPSLRTP
jgi:hypothetical protein